MTEPQAIAPAPDEQIPEGYTLLTRVDSPESFPTHLGRVYRKTIDGGLGLGVRLEARHCNMYGDAHGGLLSALADIVLGACAFRAPSIRPAGLSTLSLNIQYLDRGHKGDWLEVTGRVSRAGRSIAFTNADFHVGDRLIAQASGTFKYNSAAGMQRRKALVPDEEDKP